MLNFFKKKNFVIRKDSLENLANTTAAALITIEKALGMIIDKYFEEKIRILALMIVLSKKFGLDERAIEKEVNNLIDNNREDMDKIVKDYFEVANQVNKIFEQDKNG